MIDPSDSHLTEHGVPFHRHDIDDRDTTADARRIRARAGAPQTFSTTNRTSPAFGDEEWATGEP